MTPDGRRSRAGRRAVAERVAHDHVLERQAAVEAEAARAQAPDRAGRDLDQDGRTWPRPIRGARRGRAGLEAERAGGGRGRAVDPTLVARPAAATA